MRFLKIFFSHFFGLLENVICAVFRPLYQNIFFACIRIKIGVLIQHNHSFERSYQFRLEYIYIYIVYDKTTIDTEQMKI